MGRKSEYQNIVIARTLEGIRAFGQRLKTGKFSSSDLEKIAAALGAEASFNFTFPDGTKV